MNQADNLRAALEQTEGHLHQKGEEKVEGVPESNGKAPSHRQGKKVIMGHFPKKTHLQLKLLAVANRRQTSRSCWARRWIYCLKSMTNR